MLLVKRILALLVLVGLLACSSTEEKENKEGLSAEALYNQAMTDLNEEKYEKAVEGFAEVERQYPYSKWAIKGQVMTAYAHYKDKEYDDALLVIDRFTKLNPGNVDIDYIYYMKALCYYDRIADIRRDQEITRQAQAALEEVITRFPETEYAKDAKLKLDLVQDHLAGKEIEIGRFYQRQKQYIAAINRFKQVVEQYETTNHAAEALFRLVETYLTLGVEEEAKKYAAVLGHNYPASIWYNHAYALLEGEKVELPEGKDEAWWKRVF